MQFNSYIFVLAFLPLSLIGYFTLLKWNQLSAKVFLLIASFAFYGYVNYKMLFFLTATVLFNFAAHRTVIKLGKSDTHLKKANTIAIIAIIINVCLLCYCKYTRFFIDNLNAVFGEQIPIVQILVPLGISFITFQQIAFLVDTKRKEVKACNLLDYALFVGFFPKILAGPIVLHDEFLPQLERAGKQGFDVEKFAKGLTMFAFGLAKKVLIADTFGKVVNWGYSGDILGLGASNGWIIVLSYTFQIYFDFSGYCDMADGISRMFGYELPLNFNSPYKAMTITDFWRRWHITLTRFLTRYIYYPLGGNRKGVGRTYINIVIVFLISGFWHGAAWTFLLWGVMHGVAQVVDRLWHRTKKRDGEQFTKWHPAMAWICTFLFVSLAWIYFRAPDINTGTMMLKQLVNFNAINISPEIIKAFTFTEGELLFSVLKIPEHGWIFMVVFLCISLYAVVNMKHTQQRVLLIKPNFVMAAITIVLLVWSILSFAGVSEFVYGAF